MTLQTKVPLGFRWALRHPWCAMDVFILILSPFKLCSLAVGSVCRIMSTSVRIALFLLGISLWVHSLPFLVPGLRCLSFSFAPYHYSSWKCFLYLSCTLGQRYSWKTLEIHNSWMILSLLNQTAQTMILVAEVQPTTE